jgi:hypothetical protein
MRAAWLTVWFMVAIAASGCGSSLGPAADAGAAGHGGGGAAGASGSGGASPRDASADGAAFCAQALGDECSASPLQIDAAFCTLDMGIQAACRPCGAQDGQDCGLRGALVRGAKYTYVQILNVDVAVIFVYAQNGSLVA